MTFPTLLTLPNALGLFALVNLWTFMLFGFDKIRAAQGTWRVSEGALLAWAFLVPLRLARRRRAPKYVEKHPPRLTRTSIEHIQ